MTRSQRAGTPISLGVEMQEIGPAYQMSPYTLGTPCAYRLRVRQQRPTVRLVHAAVQSIWMEGAGPLPHVRTVSGLARVRQCPLAIDRSLT
jgi:hypothetical protein